MAHGMTPATNACASFRRSPGQDRPRRGADEGSSRDSMLRAPGIAHGQGVLPQVFVADDPLHSQTVCCDEAVPLSLAGRRPPPPMRRLLDPVAVCDSPRSMLSSSRTRRASARRRIDG
jgi:hypothetical protein